MQSLTTPLLCKACRIFLSLAYPDGPESIPKAKRFYYDLPADQEVGVMNTGRKICVLELSFASTV